MQFFEKHTSFTGFEEVRSFFVNVILKEELPPLPGRGDNRKEEKFTQLNWFVVT